MARDDFPPAVKTQLGRRVGYKCSNPDCQVATIGPQRVPNGSISLGVAAHISAASAGGPRFDPELSAARRASLSNGIWLCQNCAKLIDSDPQSYSTALLHLWKAAAEDAAAKDLGRGGVPDRPSTHHGVEVRALADGTSGYVLVRNSGPGERFEAVITGFVASDPAAVCRPSWRTGEVERALKWGAEDWLLALQVEPEGSPPQSWWRYRPLHGPDRWADWLARRQRRTYLVRFLSAASPVDVEVEEGREYLFDLSILAYTRPPEPKRVSYGVASGGQLVIPFDATVIERAKAAAEARLRALMDSVAAAPSEL